MGHRTNQVGNTARWFDLPPAFGQPARPLIGAGQDQVVCTDSTSINLYKVPSAALNIAREDSPACKRIVSERSNFPTDPYIAGRPVQGARVELVLAELKRLLLRWTSDVAVLMLTHVNLPHRRHARHGRHHRRRAGPGYFVRGTWPTRRRCAATCLAQNADFSIGCYKYLNGGPGAPAFVWVRTRTPCQLVPATLCRAGGAMPHRSSSRPTHQPAPKQPATCAARSPSSARRSANAGWMCSPPHEVYGMRRLAPSPSLTD